jgi:hypothetical protein
MNFADGEQAVETGAQRLVLATHEAAALRADGAVVLPPLAGALVEAPR